MSKTKSIFKTGNDVEVLKTLDKVTNQILSDLEKAKKPQILSTKESADNALYDPSLGYFIAGDKKISIELNVGSIKKMTRMLFVAKILKGLLETGTVATLRECYYICKGQIKSQPFLKPLDFTDQSECDAVIAELNSLVQAYREDWNVVANEKSGLSYSKALIVTETLPDGSKAVIDLSQLGTSPYIPKNRPQDLSLSIKKGQKIDYVLAIESEGSASSLVANKFLERNNAVIVALGGQPSMGTRGWLKKLQDQLKVPIYLFTDLDAYSLTIVRAARAGAFNSLLRSKDFSAPDIKFLGVLPSDIKKYNLDFYTVNDKDPSENRALKRASDLLKTDPFFKDKKNFKYKKILEFLLSEKIRCEQQSYIGFKTKNQNVNGMEYIIVDKIKNKDYI